MKTQNETKRRDFIKVAAAAGIAAPFVSRMSWAQASPNQRVQHAAIGSGGKGGSDIGEICSHKMVELVAAADVDINPLNRLKKKYPNAKHFRDFREMLTEMGDKIDTVNVSTPDHMHGIASVTAMNMGKHVYCQKPLVQTVFESRQMLAAAAKHKVIVQMGTQLASGFYNRIGAKLIQDKVVGEIKEAFVFSHKAWGDMKAVPDKNDPIPANLDWDLWLGVAAKRNYIKGYYHPGNWRRRQDFGTGTLGDMGCHIFNTPFKGLGLTHPKTIFTKVAVPNKDNWAINEDVSWVFPKTPYSVGDIKITWISGRNKAPKHLLEMMPKGVKANQGSLLVGTEGVLLLRHGSIAIPLPQDKYKDFKYPKFEPLNHYHAFVDSVIDGKTDRLMSPIDYASKLTEFILLGNIAAKFANQTLEWDAAKMAFSNNPEANKALKRDYREGWEFPKV